MSPLAQWSAKRGDVLSSTFMIERLEKSARPALASLPDAPAPYVAVWLTPQLNDRTSIWPALLVLGPSTPSINRYALTAIQMFLHAAGPKPAVVTGVYSDRITWPER